MRLSDRMIRIIKAAASYGFGESDIYLFGSRVDDTKKGGDIDIAIDTDLSHKEFRKGKVRFIEKILSSGLDIKIDVVKYRPDNELLEWEIRQNSVKL